MNPNNRTSADPLDSHQLQAIIFDMDGTLVATTEADFLAWQKLFQEFGNQLSFEDYYPLLGRKSQDVVSHVLGLKGEQAEYAMSKKMFYFEEIVNQHGIANMPHIENVLDDIHRAKMPIALATSSRKKKMELVMKRSGLYRYFDVFVSGEEVTHGKPDPEIFILAAQKLHADPLRCIVVEDTISGVAAAKAAGMKCIAITSTHEEHELGMADMVINDYSSLSFDVIRKIS